MFERVQVIVERNGSSPQTYCMSSDTPFQGMMRMYAQQHGLNENTLLWLWPAWGSIARFYNREPDSTVRLHIHGDYTVERLVRASGMTDSTAPIVLLVEQV